MKKIKNKNKDTNVCKKCRNIFVIKCNILYQEKNLNYKHLLQIKKVEILSLIIYKKLNCKSKRK